MGGRIPAVLLAAVVAGAMLPAQASAQPNALDRGTARIVHAAERGSISSQARLGWMYANGKGVPQNYMLAAYWYEQAARRGHGIAQFQLGLLYDKGQGVPQDLVLAYFWLNLSAARARGEDRDYRVRIRDAIATKMTFGQLGMAQGLSVTRFPR